MCETQDTTCMILYGLGVIASILTIVGFFSSSKNKENNKNRSDPIIINNFGGTSDKNNNITNKNAGNANTNLDKKLDTAITAAIVSPFVYGAVQGISNKLDENKIESISQYRDTVTYDFSDHGEFIESSRDAVEAAAGHLASSVVDGLNATDGIDISDFLDKL